VLSRRAIVDLLNLLDGESITVFDDDLDRVAKRLRSGTASGLTLPEAVLDVSESEAD
jgi:hypothetical protein